jgi:hypothetical protein
VPPFRHSSRPGIGNVLTWQHYLRSVIYRFLCYGKCFSIQVLQVLHSPNRAGCSLLAMMISIVTFGIQCDRNEQVNLKKIWDSSNKLTHYVWRCVGWPRQSRLLLGRHRGWNGRMHWVMGQFPEDLELSIMFMHQCESLESTFSNLPSLILPSSFFIFHSIIIYIFLQNFQIFPFLGVLFNSHVSLTWLQSISPLNRIFSSSELCKK